MKQINVICIMAIIALSVLTGYNAHASQERDTLLLSLITERPAENTADVTEDLPPGIASGTCEELPPLPYYLTAEERGLVERVVMSEAGNQPAEGIMAVAQCILDACRKDGIRPDEVIKRYQYTARRLEPTPEVAEAVAAVFDRGERVTAEEIYFFYNPALEMSAWHEAQTFVCEIAGHRFFR